MRRSVLVYLIFILSGAAGLIYEVVWARQLVLVFGNTTQAVSAILTGFFGGMAIGAFVGGRLADRVRSPLRLYGVLEVALVVVVILTPITFRLINEIYRGAYGSLESSPQSLALIRFGLALLALGPATVLMGATLPTLTRHLSARGQHLSGAFGRLYAANTFGAILGTLLSGLVLIELLGLTGALVVGATCSGMAGLVALAMSRSATGGATDRVAPAVERPSQAAAAAATTSADARPMLALLVAFVSGLTSLGYQVLWTRLLSSGTGGSTYVFTLILAVFLTGIALGAVIFSVLRPRFRDTVALLAATQVLVGLLALLGLVLVIGHPAAVNPNAPIATLRSILRAVLLVVFPATVVMGLAFPASSALLDDRRTNVASAAGQLLAANTLGAISGTFLIPFFVIPAIGSPRAVVALALVNCATALVLAIARIRAPQRRVAIVSAALATSLAIVVAIARPGLVVDPGAARVASTHATVAASAEDEIAAVLAGQTTSGRYRLWVGGTSMTALTVDARIMPLLPLMLRPQSTSAAIVAFGMGSSYRTALRAGLDVESAELVPSVPKMFGVFYPDAESVLADPRGRVVIADGRNHIELTPRRYDIIVTDPPPPITASGVSVISSKEYYEAGRERLNPGGVMMQWMPFGGSVDEFKAHLRTFRAVFPNVLVAIGISGAGVFMLGSEQPMQLTDAAIRAGLERPNMLEDLSSTYDSPAHDETAWTAAIKSLVWLQGDDVSRFVGDGPLVTDDHPLPEYFVLRRLFGPKSPPVSPTRLRQLASGSSATP
jgi:spermidine synthase